MSCFRFIAAEKANHPISLMCRVLGVSRSGLHAWQRRPPSERQIADVWMGEQIRAVHAESRGTYGARRVHAALRHRGIRVGRKRVERLMRALGLSGLLPRRRGKTTIRTAYASPTIWSNGTSLRRGRTSSGSPTSSTSQPGRGWLYLAAVVDCFSRRVVGWSMRTDLQAELVIDALEMAVARRRPAPGLVHHSDSESVGCGWLRAA